MNMNQIVNMFIRLLMRKGINAGISKGVGMARGAGKSRAPAPQQPQHTMSPEEEEEFLEFKRQKKLARQEANKAKRKNQTVNRM